MLTKDQIKPGLHLHNGGTMIGKVIRVEGEKVFVQWHNWARGETIEYPMRTVLCWNHHQPDDLS